MNHWITIADTHGYRALCLVLSMMLALWSHGAWAREGRHNLRLFIAQADVPPYSMGKTGDKGLLADMLRAVAVPLGYRITTRRMPDRRGWGMLERGELDVYACAREWVPRPEQFLWTDPFMTCNDVLVSLAGHPVHYSRPLDLYGKTVAGIRDFVYPALESHFGPDKIVRLDATTPDIMLELLRRNRVDAILINQTVILWMLRSRGDLEPKQFNISPTPVDRAYYRFLFPVGLHRESVVEQFNRRIRTMKRDGSLKAVLDKYR